MRGFRQQIKEIEECIKFSAFSKEYPKHKAELDLKKSHEYLKAAKDLVELNKVGVSNEQLACARLLSIHALHDMGALDSAIQP